MAATTHVTCLYDPLCGWCYGASAILETLASRPGFAVDFMATGLFAGDGARPMDDGFAEFAWTNDQRISRLTGQPFSDAYRQNVLTDRKRLFDSGPATLALTAVTLAAPDLAGAALKAIQTARYVEGRDITDIEVLSDVLRIMDLAEVADHLEHPDEALMAAYSSGINAARLEMHRFGANGVPALIVGAGDNRRLVQSNALFVSPDDLIARLRAMSEGSA
ncbi:DsbA family protein [Nisaea sp.]|uniref:DsbA family protein n=1 Tax=Nisaea sp. TaxID=2024842 RepID=UPI003297F861